MQAIIDSSDLCLARAGSDVALGWSLDELKWVPVLLKHSCNSFLTIRLPEQ